MPKLSIHDLLMQSFPKSNKEDWVKKASEELKGDNPFDVLRWATKDSQEFLPYYDAQDVRTFEYLKNFHFPVSTTPHTSTRAWQSLAKIDVSDVEKANALALSYLASGADGILFDLRKYTSLNISILLEGVDWPYCNVSFLVDPATKLIVELLAHIQRKKYDPALLNGAIFWENITQQSSTSLEILSHLPEFHSLGIYIRASSPVQEISEALTKAAMLMDVLTDQGFEKEMVLGSISLSFCVETDFFTAIAKLKAIRMLWYQFAQAFEIRDFNPSNLQLHARSEIWINERIQPHSNMLKSTTASLAAVLGGCDCLTIEAEDEDSILMNRIARNVSTILYEESHLDKVADPVAGAYAIDYMVHHIAQAAWKAFQEKMKRS